MRTRPYNYPDSSLLLHDAGVSEAAEDAEARKTAAKLQGVLDSFRVNGKISRFKVGAQKTTFLCALGAGVTVRKVTALKDNFSLAVGGQVSVGLYKDMISIEAPNEKRRMIRLGDFKGDFSGTSSLGVALGDNVVCDLAKMPHILIAGTTGSGKSVCINSIITGLLLRNHPDLLKFIMIDPKKVELGPYNGIPHLLTPVITDTPAAVSYLNLACREMEKRYTEFERVGVKNIEEYAAAGYPKFQRIVVVIDELADLMLTSKKAVEPAIVRLAQKARAAGIHLVIATQRPTRDVITGLIKANIPARIAFKCISGIDSRVILDQTGAENLLGHGDMLYKPGDAITPVRLQGVYVTNEEIESICDFIRNQGLSNTRKPERKGFFRRKTA